MNLFNILMSFEKYTGLDKRRSRRDENERPFYKNTARNKREAQKKRNKRRK